MNAVWMTCNNCGHVDSGPDGAMYECPSCGWGDGWGAESHVEAQKRSAQIVERGRLDALPSGEKKPQQQEQR